MQMATGTGGRARVWPARLGALAVVGGLLGLLTWRLELPRWPWAAACLGASSLLCVAHGLAVEWLHRRWDDRAVAAYRAGAREVPPPPRGSVVVLAIAAGLALAGGSLVTLGLIERYG
jgi:hypothetical protein